MPSGDVSRFGIFLPSLADVPPPIGQLSSAGGPMGASNSCLDTTVARTVAPWQVAWEHQDPMQAAGKYDPVARKTDHKPY